MLLTDRERQVLDAASEGMCDKEIAAQLGISDKTVHTYWSRIREKLQAKNRTHAVALLLRSDRSELPSRISR